jgi:hypothetical protein
MHAISEEDIKVRIARDNPWWNDKTYAAPEALQPHRVYFEPFKRLALNFEVKRATILLGPRRVSHTAQCGVLLCRRKKRDFSPRRDGGN